MKVLLIGMDGAHRAAFDRGWTPFIQGMIENGTSFNPYNDLISRGWLEIATGEHASFTGAMYDKPMANGTHQWSYKFSLGDVPNLGKKIKPIWQKLNERGFKVGIMNLPTVFPAPKVNGFFVSGGGGGASVVSDPTPELCYPNNVKKTLEKHGYIVDCRMEQIILKRGLKSPSEITEFFKNMNNTRTDSFINLALEHKIDFGFLVYKTTSVNVETMINPELKKKSLGLKNYDKSIINACREYYSSFDNNIRRLSQEFPDSEIIFVSDHGHTPKLYSFNPNVLLQKLNFQTIRKKGAFKLKLFEFVKAVLPFKIKKIILKNSKIKKASLKKNLFINSKTLAFCHTRNDWSHGIFINDKERFGGPVENSKVKELTEIVLKKLNNSEELKEHNILAYEGLKRKPNKTPFPDIVFRLPKGYLTSDSINQVFVKTNYDHNNNGLQGITKGKMMSIKSPNPIFVTSKNTTLASEQKVTHLTDVYSYIVSIFKKQTFINAKQV